MQSLLQHREIQHENKNGTCGSFRLPSTPILGAFEAPLSLLMGAVRAARQDACRLSHI